MTKKLILQAILVALTAVFLGLPLQAQEVVNIHRTNNTVERIWVSELDSISFNADGTNTCFHTKEGAELLPIAEIDSLTFGVVENTISIHYEGAIATVHNPYAGQGVEVVVEGADVTVTSTIGNEVEYLLTGTTNDGSFKLYGQKKFILSLGGVSLTNVDGPAINIQTGKKTTVNMVDGTMNTLVDGTTYTPCGEEDMKGTFFSEGQLVIGGKGRLDIQGHYRHGLCSDDYITINEGTINIQISADTGKGIKCNDDLTVNGGTISIHTTGNTVVSEGDASYCSAMKSDANLYLYGGNITAVSSGTSGRGLSADGEIVIGQGETEGPTLQVTTTGKQIYISGSGMNADYATPKCVKADGNLTVYNGNIYIKSTQDGGEGLESKAILTIHGGTIEVETVDDPINAATHLAINGGRIYCYASNNDGIDSNGTINIAGGIVISSGANTPEEGIDCDQNRFAITGGVLIATGGATSTPTASACTQRSIIYNGSSLSGKLMNIQDAGGNNVLTYQMPVRSNLNNQAVVLISTPSLQASTSYTLYTGGSVSSTETFHGYYSDASCTGCTQTATFTTTNMVTTIGTGGGGGGFPGGGGGRPR